MRSTRSRALAIPVWLLGVALSALSQTAVTAVNGTALDQSGAVTPCAAVHLLVPAGEQTTLTDRVGHFELNAQPGTYELRVEADGFQPNLQPHLRVSAEHIARLKIILKIATAR
jgi:uncharacterized membrane protein